jgi:hypothetical protein
VSQVDFRDRDEASVASVSTTFGLLPLRFNQPRGEVRVRAINVVSQQKKQIRVSHRKNARRSLDVLHIGLER